MCIGRVRKGFALKNSNKLVEFWINKQKNGKKNKNFKYYQKIIACYELINNRLKKSDTLFCFLLITIESITNDFKFFHSRILVFNHGN